MDHELQCFLRNPSAEALEKFESRMAMSRGTWTVSMAETLLSAVRECPQLLHLLVTAEMDDHVIFAVQHHLPNLTDHVVQQQGGRPLALIAMVCMWEALERIRSCTTSLLVDTLWIYSHVEPRKLNDMALVAVDIITRYERNLYLSNEFLSPTCK